MSRFVLLAALLLAACGGTESALPTQRLQLGTERAAYDFSETMGEWDTFIMPGDSALFRVNNDVLEGAIVDNLGYIWSLDEQNHYDVAAQVTVRQTEGMAGSGYGVMCRAQDNGDGYYFLISGQGRFSIRKGTREQNDLIALIDWQDTPAVRRGSEANTLLAICAGDYLALFINDQFVGEAHDATFERGQLGVTLAAAGDATAWVAFDDILVRDVLILGPR